jgi:aspartyl-tRNA(Asn)/glutamyl-tRNA(Gln) amidotransferase subunit A
VNGKVTPTVPILPTEIGQREIDIHSHKRLVRLELTRLTGPTNFTGLPSLSMPCGLSASGLPIGLQLVGRPFDEANLYRFGQALEQELSIPAPEI